MNIRLIQIVGSVAIFALATAAGPMPSSVDHGPTTGTQTETQTCRFSIKATNDRDVDVVVMLYDSRVFWSIYNRQLKIQNYRIAPGKSMDVRYEAPGRCSVNRSWTFYTRRGGWDGRKGYMGYKTSGDTTDGRTINLGRTSGWPFQG